MRLYLPADDSGRLGAVWRANIVKIRFVYDRGVFASSRCLRTRPIVAITLGASTRRAHSACPGVVAVRRDHAACPLGIHTRRGRAACSRDVFARSVLSSDAPRSVVMARANCALTPRVSLFEKKNKISYLWYTGKLTTRCSIMIQQKCSVLP